MLGNQLLNSVPGFEEDLNRLKGWTSCTPLVKPIWGGRWTTRARARSPRRAEAEAVAVAVAEAVRGRTWHAGAVRCDVMCWDEKNILLLRALKQRINVDSNDWRITPVTAAHQSSLRHPGSLNLRHLHAYINHPFLLSSTHFSTWSRYSCLGDLSLLPLLLSAVPIASTARTALARAGLRNLCSLKVLHGSKQDLNVLGARGINTVFAVMKK